MANTYTVNEDPKTIVYPRLPSRQTTLRDELEKVDKTLNQTRHISYNFGDAGSKTGKFYNE